eukprot:m.213900 g.213900  ORF g.213900 m.213900 type:complete len:57 (+) comp17181_c0_seq10:885-1055(+)
MRTFYNLRSEKSKCSSDNRHRQDGFTVFRIKIATFFLETVEVEGKVVREITLPSSS